MRAASACFACAAGLSRAAPPRRAAQRRPFATASPPRLRVLDARGAPVAYAAGLAWQRALGGALRASRGRDDALLLLEHAPVYTLGAASDPRHVLFSEGAGAELVRTERGGEVTFHGPGQVVCYPVLDLGRHRKDLHWYLRALEEVVIDALRGFGVAGGRKEGLTGVWVGDEKVAAMGLKVSRWVTMHGLALNVDMDLSPFDEIVPCGIAEYGVTSLRKVAPAGTHVSVALAKERIVQSFARVFGPYALHLETDVHAALREAEAVAAQPP